MVDNTSTISVETGDSLAPDKTDIALSRLQLGKRFTSILLLALLLLGISFSVHYLTEREAARKTHEASESLNIDLARRTLVRDISAVMSDLLFLAEQVMAVRNSGERAEVQRDVMKDLFRNFAEQKHLYDQIRLLDDAGHEAVRINFNGGDVVAVDESVLQNKSDRYYFLDAISLARGQVYISSLDLNIEEGQLELPYKPVLRFATPVFDKHGNRWGIVVLNYFGEQMINQFLRSASNIVDHVQLVNADGYWLSSPRQEDEWGFALGNERRFSSRYPLAWQHIDRYDADQFTTEQGLFTFTTISAISIARLATEVGYDVGMVPAFNADEGEYFWKIISTLPASELSASPLQFMAQHRTIYGSMLLLVLVGSFLLARSRIHQQRTAELGQYERRFRRTLETIQLAAVSLDRNGRVTFANDYFQRLTGRSPREIIGLDWLQSFTPADKQRAMAKVLDRLEEPASFPRRVEMQVMAKDNEPRLVAWHNTLSFDAAGRVSGVTAIGEDITERRSMEEELHRLFRAVEQSSSIIMITDNMGRIEYVNQKFYDVTGYSAEEIIGNQPSILSSGEKSAEEYRELWKSITSGGEWRGEFHNRRKNGELYWEAATISAIRGVDGEVTHFLAVKEDITERKQMQQTIDDRNRELARTQALATMGRMASMIAHDLRNPLSSVKMGWQIVNKKYLADQEVQELGEIARDQILYMENILSDMLTYSRPEEMKQEWLSPEKVINEALTTVRRQLDENGVESREDLQQGLPTFPGDGYKLRQVISNLITNAMQATLDNDEGDRVIVINAKLELGEGGTVIRFSLCDNGCGIDAGQEEKLFEPFYTTRAKGTGLGLAIVRQIVEQHRGAIQLLPGSARGTCAVLTLPTVPADGVTTGMKGE